MALLGDDSRPGRVTFAFTERTGGISEGPYASLNLCMRQGDDSEAVAENRARALSALGLSYCADQLVMPLQVHGTNVVTIATRGAEAFEAARVAAEAGADAIVCTVSDVPVMLLHADCPLIVLVCAGGFAVVHSGWRSTIGGIAGRALAELCRVAQVQPADVCAYVGPHIQRDDYEVSRELADRFADRFGTGVIGPGRTLDLSCAIRMSLAEAGLPAGQMAFAEDSTASCPERYFSYRASGGVCGRQAAIACLAHGKGGASTDG